MPDKAPAANGHADVVMADDEDDDEEVRCHDPSMIISILVYLISMACRGNCAACSEHGPSPSQLPFEGQNTHKRDS